MNWSGQVKVHVEPTCKSQSLDVTTGLAGAAHDVASLTTTSVHRSPANPALHELHILSCPNDEQPLLESVVQTVPHPVGAAVLVICLCGVNGGGWRLRQRKPSPSWKLGKSQEETFE